MNDDRLGEGHGLARVPNVDDRPGGREPAARARLALDDAAADAAWQLVVALAAASIVPAGGVSLGLVRGGRLRLVAASSEQAAAVDAAQDELGEGPGPATAQEGRRMHIAAVDDEARWPAFVARAGKLGIGAVLSSPVSVGSRTVGVLSVYSPAPRSFGGMQRSLASAFALQASVVLTAQEDGDLTAASLARGLAHALEQRETQALALGILSWTSSEASERYQVWGADDEALERDFSPPGETGLRDKARELLRSSRLVGRPVRQLSDRRAG